jgi:hypothetical protein
MRTLLPFALVLALLGAFRAGAEEFPPITAEEKALTSVPGEPNAPAVVLFKKGEFLMAGYGRLVGSLTSHLTVRARVKILTETGKGNGEIAIAHNSDLRLQGFSGRTVLPDGRILPVPADARFERRTSKSRKTFVTTVAFPAIQPGAILDYRYEVTFSSPFLLEPWIFSEEVPVLRSEVLFRTPGNWTYQIWNRSPLEVTIHQERQKTSGGYEVHAWAENLPAVPDDPYGPPYADLASQMTLLPVLRADIYGQEGMMSSWRATSRLVSQLYLPVIRLDDGLTRTVRKVAGAGDLRRKAEALYRFVRDEIRTEPGDGILVDIDQTTLKKILAERRGTGIEKALLLQNMLREAGIGSLMIWAADPGRVTLDDTLPSPGWFDTAFVMIELDFERTFLDPAAPGLAFGQIRPQYEGTAARVFETSEGIVLPETPFGENLRRAEVDLSVDEKGRLAGTGTLRLTGPRAAEQLHGNDDPAKAAQAWTDWLAERWREYRISNLQVAEMPEERKVTVTWAMAQREEEALGDEATVMPSAPLGLASQPFAQAERKIDVVFDHPYRDEVELRLRWPEGWKLDRAPAAAKVEKFCGTLSTAVEPDPGGHALVVRRRLDVTRRKITPAGYEDLRALFGEAVKSDAQGVTLAKR